MAFDLNTEGQNSNLLLEDLKLLADSFEYLLYQSLPDTILK